MVACESPGRSHCKWILRHCKIVKFRGEGKRVDVELEENGRLLCDVAIERLQSVSESPLLRHLAACSKSPAGLSLIQRGNVVRCPFDGRHYVARGDLLAHSKCCPSRFPAPGDFFHEGTQPPPPPSLVHLPNNLRRWKSTPDKLDEETEKGQRPTARAEDGTVQGNTEDEEEMEVRQALKEWANERDRGPAPSPESSSSRPGDASVSTDIESVAGLIEAADKVLSKRKSILQRPAPS